MANTSSFSLEKAVILVLGDMVQPVITDYQLGLIVWRLYLKGHFRGQQLKIEKQYPERSDFSQIISSLQEIGIINERKDFPQNSVFSILGKEDFPPEEIACTVDPFAYVSHLSAMAYHGLTDMLPQMVFLSSPAAGKWREFASDRMKKDLGADASTYYKNKLPKLLRIRITKIARRPIHRYAGVHLGAFKLVKDRPLRVSTIGRTFLDMLRKPELCGGIHHVLDVFTDSAEQYLNLIADEIDRHGKNIDKVRAGYVLEELCRLKSDRIDKWLQYVQRGGSQKLDPSREYSSTYSERWSLSINID